MQFGVTDHVDRSGIAPADQLEERLRLVALYDRLGFDRYMLTEHHGTPLSLAPSPHLLLAAAAQRTLRIRLGTLMTLLPLYNPMRLIEEVGMLDLLSRGRLELGIGRGISPPEIATYGIDPADAPAMFEEAYEILLKGLNSEVLSHEGRFHTMTDVPMVVAPLQRPRPPLWYGVASVERAEWVARNRINMISLVPAEQVRPFTERFCGVSDELGLSEAERPLRAVDRHLVVADSAAEARRVATEAYVQYRGLLLWLWERSGVVPRREFPKTWDDAQRVGTAFAGTPADARDYIAEQVEVAGVDAINFHLAFGNLSFEQVCRSAELLAAEVMPAFGPAEAHS